MAGRCAGLQIAGRRRPVPGDFKLLTKNNPCLIESPACGVGNAVVEGLG